ncbi:hypothetical protein I4U23_003252 [Adineta vaga]|nr:hypothetical protein I4U23_003252 [Adineta vaga]
MNRSVIPAILRELDIKEDEVVCIYNYGSWVYGTNSATSDRDLLIVRRTLKNTPLTFEDEIDYFHNFELHKLWNQYDVCVHTVENFETLLQKNYLLAVECVFLPAEFKIKEEIDFQKIYLDNYYDPSRIKTVAFYENYISVKMYNLDDYTLYPIRSGEPAETSEAGKIYLFKNLFHGFRYLDIAKQLIETKSIHDFKRVSHVLNEMKQIRDDSSVTDSWESVLKFVNEKSAENKSQLNTLIPTNRIKGTFELHVTIDCTHNTEEVIENLKKTCENTKYKVLLIDLESTNKKRKLQQLMTSSYHGGEYPEIVPKLEEEVHKHFEKFNIIRLKIESLASNEGVPEKDLEKELFWNNESNYFEFHYKVLLKDNHKMKNYEQLRQICQYSGERLHLSQNAFKCLDDNNYHYMITMRLFDCGRYNALERNETIINYLTMKSFPPLKVVREFIVYDNHIALDNGWQ